MECASLDVSSSLIEAGMIDTNMMVEGQLERSLAENPHCTMTKDDVSSKLYKVGICMVWLWQRFYFRNYNERKSLYQQSFFSDDLIYENSEQKNYKVIFYLFLNFLGIREDVFWDAEKHRSELTHPLLLFQGDLFWHVRVKMTDDDVIGRHALGLARCGGKVPPASLFRRLRREDEQIALLFLEWQSENHAHGKIVPVSCEKSLHLINIIYLLNLANQALLSHPLPWFWPSTTCQKMKSPPINNQSLRVRTSPHNQHNWVVSKWIYFWICSLRLCRNCICTRGFAQKQLFAATEEMHSETT